MGWAFKDHSLVHRPYLFLFCYSIILIKKKTIIINEVLFATTITEDWFLIVFGRIESNFSVYIASSESIQRGYWRFLLWDVCPRAPKERQKTRISRNEICNTLQSERLSLAESVVNSANRIAQWRTTTSRGLVKAQWAGFSEAHAVIRLSFTSKGFMIDPALLLQLRLIFVQVLSACFWKYRESILSATLWSSVL